MGITRVKKKEAYAFVLSPVLVYWIFDVYAPFWTKSRNKHMLLGNYSCSCHKY